MTVTQHGFMHGGVVTMLADTACGFAALSLMPEDAAVLTTEFKINYLAAVETGLLDARAQIISLTKRTAVVRIDVENEGRLACAAQGTVLVVAPKQ